MVFNSYVFIFVFLPLVLVGYYALNHYGKHKGAQVFLIGMSLVFYGYFNFSYVFLLAGSITLNWMIYCRLRRTPRKAVFLLGLVVNLGILGWFKYFDFFVENLNALLGTSFLVRGVLLPLGISFFTFQQISFLADTYRGEVEECDFLEYALFVVFFPQLVAGPIVLHDEMIRQFRNPENRKLEAEWMVKGFQLFTLGLCKKVLLADVFGPVADWGFANHAILDSSHAILTAVLFTFQLYFDFSGYCDMAKGVGYMLHVTLPANFDSPYQSAGIMEFWKRWHVTLGRFFTKYVYIPLGGSRRGRARTCRNALIVFFLSGLWHGAEWTFVIWGVMHGVGYVLDYLGKPLLSRVPRFLRKGLTFVFVCLAFVAFRAGSVEVMCNVYKAIFGGNWQVPGAFLQTDELCLLVRWLNLDRLPGAAYYPMIFYLGLSAYLVFVGKNSVERVEKGRYGVCNAVVMGMLFLYCIVSMSGVSIFLYFNF